MPQRRGALSRRPYLWVCLSAQGEEAIFEAHRRANRLETATRQWKRAKDAVRNSLSESDSLEKFGNSQWFADAMFLPELPETLRIVILISDANEA